MTRMTCGMVHMSVGFRDKISALCALELSGKNRHPEALSEMIEALTNSLAFTVSMAAAGDPSRVQELLTGVEHYLYEATGSYAKVGKLLGGTIRP